jgi:chaperone BCS1
VLAGELQLDICILNLTHAGLTDDAIAEHLRDAPQNSVIVLEDVDAIFVERTATKEGDKRGGNTTVSFSGLLNALDGVASQEGRLLFMTTNHIEKLDPALIRPGRCDVQLQLKLASKNQMERMFLRFYPGEEDKAKKFAASLPANELSMAALQGYFLRCSDSAQACLDQTR